MKGHPVILAAVLAILSCCDLLHAEKRVYEERAGDRVTIHRFIIRESGAGFSIDLVSQTGDQQTRQRYELDNSLAALSWQYEYPAEKTALKAVREGNKIALSGLDRGKPIEKTFKINDLPWNQSFNVGLEKFALSPAKELRFWCIGTTGPGRMKITKFAAKKTKEETINLGGQPVTAVHIKMSLTGLLSLFWKGHYWYRKTDGTFIRYRGKGSGSPLTIMQLVSQTDHI